jgi:ribosomal-protein-alanine N-acetyltransferase
VQLTWPAPLPAHGAVRLRPFRDSDLPLIAELAHDPYVPTIGTVPNPYTDEAGLAYLARQHQRLTDGTGWSFAIAAAADDRAVGGIGLWIRDLGAGRATAGYVVAPGERGRGFATDALRALIDFAWTLPDLHRVELYIEEWNIGSLRVAAGAGFTHEGVLRSHQEIGGTRRDMLLFAAVRGER